MLDRRNESLTKDRMMGLSDVGTEGGKAGLQVKKAELIVPVPFFHSMVYTDITMKG